MTHCKNCGQPLHRNFCAGCGQKADTHRFTIHHLMHELIHAVTHADKSVFGFVKVMITHPGETIRNYLAGQRKRYFNPFTAFILALGIELVVAGVLQRHPPLHAIPEEQRRYAVEAWVHHNLKLLFIFLLPVLSLLTWSFYRKYNYAEHFVMNVFNATMISLFYVVFYLLGWAMHWPEKIMLFVQFGVSYVYYVYVIRGLLPGFPFWKIILYQLIITLLCFAFNFFLVGISLTLFFHG